MQFAMRAATHQSLQTGHETGQRFTTAGRRNQQRVITGFGRLPKRQLMGAGLPIMGAKPAVKLRR